MANSKDNLKILIENLTLGEIVDKRSASQIRFRYTDNAKAK